MEKLLSFRVLGDFSVTDRAGRQIALRRRKGAALLAYLAAHCDDWVSRDALATMLWSEMEPKRARVNLRQLLRITRADLGPVANAVEISSTALRLSSQSITSDLEALRCALRGNDVDRALRLYRGRFLNSLAIDEADFDLWVENAATQIETDTLTCLRSEFERHVGNNENCSAKTAARNILRIDRCDEAAHAYLIHLYSAQGQTVRALRQFETCRAALLEDYDVPPGRKVENAIVSVLRQGEAGDRSGGTKPSIAVEVDERTFEWPGSSVRDELLHFLSMWREFRTADGTKESSDFVLKVAPGICQSDEIFARVLRCRNGEVLWAGRYGQSDSTTLASAIAYSAARVIELAIPEDTNQTNPVVQLVRRGRVALRARTRRYTHLAHHLFSSALLLEPNNGVALSGLASSIAFPATQGWIKPWELCVRQATDAVQRAIEIDPQDGTFRALYASLLLNAGRHDDALAEAEHAVVLNSSNVVALGLLGVVRQAIGHEAVAVEHLDRAAEMIPEADTYSTAIQSWYARALLGVGEYEKAAAIARRQIERDPNYGTSYLAFATALHHGGDQSGAQNVMLSCNARLPEYIAYRRRYQECRSDKLERHVNAALFDAT